MVEPDLAPGNNPAQIVRSPVISCPAFFAVPAVAMLVGCVPVENQRGYVPDQQAVASVKVGTDTKDTVSRKLGDPSTAATFGNDVWYYMSAHVEQNAFFAPHATERNILAVEFTKDGKVADHA